MGGGVISLWLMALIIAPIFSSLIGMILLRGACSLLNRFLPKSDPKLNLPEQAFDTVTQVEPSESSDNPFQSPKQTDAAMLHEQTGGQFVPSIIKAYLLCFVGSILGNIVGILLGTMAQSETMADVLAGFSLISNLAIFAIVLKIGLPTSWLRAFATTGIFLLLIVGVVISIGLLFGLLTVFFSSGLAPQ